jgi:hypothetical protein
MVITVTPTATDRTRHCVEIQICDFSPSGCLLKLISIFHSRGVGVTDLRYRCHSDGSATLSAEFDASARQAVTVRQSVLRSIHVTEVTLSSGTGPVLNAVGV